MGFEPTADIQSAIQQAKVLYIVGADPAGDDPVLEEAIAHADFVIVQELFPTKTTALANVILPAQTLFEREGSYTSGERRVQRFYPAVPPRGETRADFSITSQLGAKAGIDLEGTSAALVMKQIGENVPAFKGITYQALSQVVEQYPIIARDDLYYGGTSYENKQGIGVQLAGLKEGDEIAIPQVDSPQHPELSKGSLLAVPINRLYDQGQLITKSEVLQNLLPKPYVVLNTEDAESLNISEGSNVSLSLLTDGQPVNVKVDASVPAGVVLVPRSMGIPIEKPTAVTLSPAE